MKRVLSEPKDSKCSLGELVEFESQYVGISGYKALFVRLFINSYDRYRKELKGDWKDAAAPGAGQLYNLGSHIIDQVVSLFGRPSKVTAFLENVRQLGPSEVDDSVRG